MIALQDVEDPDEAAVNCESDRGSKVVSATCTTSDYLRQACFPQAGTQATVQCSIPFRKRMTSVYVHVDFLNDDFSEDELKSLEGTQVQFELHNAEGAVQATDSLPVWDLRHDISEL